jgi:hypothetical protein
MKTRLLTTITTALLAAAGISTSLAQGTAFTYQGRLTDGGTPASGWYDFRCQLYDKAEPPGDALVSVTVTNVAVPVTNGFFTLKLDFGAPVFSGQDRWLLITMRTNGALSFQALSPRQQLTPSPYALWSSTAGNLSQSANQLFTGTITFGPAAGPPFSVSTTTKVPNLNADLLDGLDSAAFVLKSGDVLSGNLTLANPATLNFGSSTRQMINLWGVGYAIGVQADAQYSRSVNDFAWYRGGTHSDTHFDAGGGQSLMTLTTNGLTVSGAISGQVVSSITVNAGANAVVGLSVGNDGVAVLGTTDFLSPGGNANSVGVIGTSTHGTGVRGVSTDVDGVVGLKGVSVKSRTIEGGVYAESAASSGNGLVAVATNGTSAYALWGIAPQGYAAYLDGKVYVTGTETVGGLATFNGAINVNYSSGFSQPQLFLKDPSDNGFARLRLETGNRGFWDIAVGTGGGVTNNMRFFNATNGDVMTLSETGNLFVKVITITGGADIAEPFKMSDKDLSKGSVVVIDEDHPGQLKLSTEPYDTRVAGVISGANGVNPGLALNQDGVIEGGQHVALTGRVYVQADASFGGIKPGDLLTTSATPGRAMKVGDHARAQGAILGKAMTSLKEGRGLVLLLVTLQ